MNRTLSFSTENKAHIQAVRGFCGLILSTAIAYLIALSWIGNPLKGKA